MAVGRVQPIAPVATPAPAGASTWRPRVLATLLVLAPLALAAAFGTYAAFSATTSNGGDQFVSGTVKIDQHAGYSALYNAANQKPGQVASGCVRVTYSGTLPATVRLYASAAITNGSAFNLTVERGNGLSSPGSGMSCTGFTASSTVYDGTLSAFPTSWATGRQAKPGGAGWTQDEAADYRFTITAYDDTTPNAHTSAQATGSHSFTWEARDYGAYRATVLATPGLLSYWRLDETSGTTATDSAPGAINGTYAGGPTLGRPSLLDGDPDPALGLDGADDNVNIGDHYDFAGTAAFSAEAWVKPGALNTATYRRVISKETTDANGRQGWDLLISSTSVGTPRFVFERWRDNVNNSIVGGPAVLAGDRHHAVITYDGTIRKLYVDGTLAASSASSLPLPDLTTPLRLGAHGAWGGGGVDGDLDDVSIYDRALSAAEVTQHYNRGNGS